jgi:hypothetical protein
MRIIGALDPLAGKLTAPAGIRAGTGDPRRALVPVGEATEPTSSPRRPDTQTFTHPLNL